LSEACSRGQFARPAQQRAETERAGQGIVIDSGYLYFATILSLFVRLDTLARR